MKKAQFQISGCAHSFTAFDIPGDYSEDEVIQFIADKYGNFTVDLSGNTFGAVSGVWDIKEQ